MAVDGDSPVGFDAGGHLPAADSSSSNHSATRLAGYAESRGQEQNGPVKTAARGGITRRRGTARGLVELVSVHNVVQLAVTAAPASLHLHIGCLPQALPGSTTPCAGPGLCVQFLRPVEQFDIPAIHLRTNRCGQGLRLGVCAVSFCSSDI